MRRPVVFENEKQQLFGVLHYPPEARKLPAVLLCHGFTGTKVESHRIFVKLAQLLEEFQLVTLRFDFRGSGDSEGDFSQMTLEGEISDARAALDYLQTLPEVDPNRLGILGLSMGGAVAATLSGRDQRISACALWSAVADFSQTFFSQAASQVIEEGKPDLDLGGNVVSREFLLQCQKAKPHLGLLGAGCPCSLSTAQRTKLSLFSTQIFSTELPKAAGAQWSCIKYPEQITPMPAETGKRRFWPSRAAGLPSNCGERLTSPAAPSIIEKEEKQSTLQKIENLKTVTKWGIICGNF